MEVFIRIYQEEDRNDVIELFQSNCPAYFDPKDLHDLTYFLDHYADSNFKVLLLEGRLVSCGGHYVKPGQQVFGIAWVMFRRYALGAGKFLQIARIFFQHLVYNIQQEPYDFDILVNTTHLLVRFLETFGFETGQVIKNGFGIGLDHVVMRRSRGLIIRPPGG